MAGREVGWGCRAGAQPRPCAGTCGTGPAAGLAARPSTATAARTARTQHVEHDVALDAAGMQVGHHLWQLLGLRGGGRGRVARASSRWVAGSAGSSEYAHTLGQRQRRQGCRPCGRRAGGAHLKVRGARARVQVGQTKVHGICPRLHRGAQLRPATRRRQHLGPVRRQDDRGGPRGRAAAGRAAAGAAAAAGRRAAGLLLLRQRVELGVLALLHRGISLGLLLLRRRRPPLARRLARLGAATAGRRRRRGASALTPGLATVFSTASSLRGRAAAACRSAHGVLQHSASLYARSGATSSPLQKRYRAEICSATCAPACSGLVLFRRRRLPAGHSVATRGSPELLTCNASPSLHAVAWG